MTVMSCGFCRKATSEVDHRKGVISAKTDTIADLEKQLQASKTKLEQAKSQVF